MTERLRAGVSVVVPVFRSTGTLVELHRRVDSALSRVPHELILVDDGSPSATWETLRALAEHPGVVALRLGRNFGQHAALLAGVRAASHEVVVTMDDDLQNAPEDIPALLAALTPDVDVVYGWSDSIAQAWWRRAGSRSVRRITSGMLGAPSSRRMGAFRALRTGLREGFALELGPAVSLDAVLTWTTQRFAEVQVTHHPRREGRSNYSFARLARFALDTVTGYSIRPLRLVTSVGIGASLVGLVVLIYAVALAVSGRSSVAGFPFLASMIAVFAGAQMLSLGIIGEYLGRTHERTQRRPTYVVAERIDGPAAGDAPS